MALHTLRKYLVIMCITIFSCEVMGYHEPFLGLGYDNILTGGPIIPTPGWYWFHYNQYYHTNNFLDYQGQPLGCVESPEYSTFATVDEFVYQSDTEVLFKGKWGLDVSLPLVFYSKINKNLLDITSSGAGFGDLGLGLYVQWDPIMVHDRAVFVHRIEFSATFPIGKNLEPKKDINPGDNIFFITPYWAGTVFFTEDWAVSWELSLVVNATDNKTHIKAGNATYLNYCLEHRCSKNFWLAVAGYYMKQVQNDTLYGVSVPHSKEQVLAIGPGLLYKLPGDFIFISYLYFEQAVRNRPQGTNFIFNLVKYF